MAAAIFRPGNRRDSAPVTDPAGVDPRPARPARRRLAGVAASLLAVTLLSGVLTSCETTRGDRLAVMNAINHSRAQHGLHPLREHGQLNHKADQWASRMRDECRIWHSRLADGAPRNWRKLGENVGRGGSIAVVHNAYMHSPGHKANILDPAYNYVGTGAVWGRCNGHRTVFTVQVFMKA